MYITLISAIRAAQRSVHITTAYFAPDSRLLEVIAGTAAEINAVVVGRGFAAGVERLFHRDPELSRHITLAQWRRRALPERFMEFLGRLTERLM